MKITALTYNLSWATQKNLLAGSEKDFVQICQNADINCFQNSLRIIKSIENLYLVGLQEVNTNGLEKYLIKNCQHLTAFQRGTYGVSSVSLIWNKEIFGKVVDKVVFNLHIHDRDHDHRPCMILLTSNGYQLIVAHFPHFSTKKQLDEIYKIILEHRFNNSLPIVFADTNDTFTLINKNSPLKLGKYKLSQGMTKSQLKKELLSCCRHNTRLKSIQYKSLDSTGDYILAPSSVIINNYIPDLYKDILASDHRPVLATLNLKI